MTVSEWQPLRLPKRPRLTIIRQEELMPDESLEKKPGLWDRTKRWADGNRTIAGAVGGFAAGTVIPGVGNVVGAVVGAGVGYWSQKERDSRHGASGSSGH